MVAHLAIMMAVHANPPPLASLYAVCALGAAASAMFVVLRAARALPSVESPDTSPSPREAMLPRLSDDELADLPYPPSALPGARDVQSPYGSVRMYEWGPEDGDKVLLIHGISTPSLALGGLAHGLVENGCRVMLFDLFSRGYSSGPSPHTHRHDSALYTSQILLCLSSSPLPWTHFTLVGYSLGGALAADFTSYFPHLITNLVLIAPGGLIRATHTTWKSRLLYSTSGLIPECIIERMVAKRLWTGPPTARTMEPEPDAATVREKGGLRSNAVYASSGHTLLPENPHSTVSNVVDWQITNHAGFVPAFISSIRYAPIHDQQHRWRVIRENIEKQIGRLTNVCLVLGEEDAIVVAGELIEDAIETLGEKNVRIEVVQGTGHEVAIERADEVVRIMGSVFGKAEEKS